jgi:tetratricopeptide (TPR) repeat protein
VSAPRVPPAALLGILLLLAGAAFLPALDGQFQYDDHQAVQFNPRVRQPLQALAALEPRDLLGPGRPVTDLFLGVVRSVGGEAPRPFHAASLALHLATAALAFLLVRGLLARLGHPRAGPLALAVAALFAVHPLQTESVCYAAQVSEVLAAALGLGAILLLLRAEERTGAGAWMAAAGAALLLLLALGAKAVAVAIPAAFLVVAWGTAPAEASAGGAPAGRRRWRALALALPALVVSAAAVAQNLIRLEGAGSTAGLSAGVGPWRYRLSQARVHWLDLRLAAWPAGQSLEHGLEPSPGLADGPTLLALAGLAALAAGLVLLWRRAVRLPPAQGAAARAVVLGLGWWFLLLAPTSSLVPIDDLAAEHRTYLPLAGLLLAALAALDALAAHRLPGRRAVAVIAVAGAALWGATLARATTWRTQESLWADAAAKNPASARAAANLAYALHRAGRSDLAAAEYARALRLPAPAAHVAAVAMNASSFEMDRGDYAAAVAIAGLGVAAAPGRSEVRANRSLALGAMGRREEALADALECVRLDPGKAFPHYALGVAFYRLGRADQARPAFDLALRLGQDGTLEPRAAFAALAALGRREAGCAAWRALEASGQGGAGLRQTAVGLGCLAR